MFLMDRIVWDPNQSVTKPKLLLDLQDEQMLVEILDNKHGDDLQPHAGAMITTRSAEKSSQQLKSHSKKCTSHGVKFLYYIPALKLLKMKAKLSKPKVLWYPHENLVALKEQGKLLTKGSMKIVLRGSFAGDLENLLDAEECDEDEEDNNNYDSNNFVAGVKGLKMRRMPSQAQADVENEDEAAELCRMLMDGIS
ncbi:unnamed protein product [Lactuca saligna]|uniref:Uncharacterized protein n=1 Tax=Lactuca saligna TaxID=75948 RepID=A0AA36E4P6_LACSI|nr:unnamed protein product [Lactuca saligna]